MNTPWEYLAAKITELGDKLSLSPVAREATVSSSAPLAVLFDTDTEETLAYGSLVASLTPGQRVLTLQLRHYVWVLGVKGGARDTGWVNLSSYIASGFRGTLMGRIVGPMVELTGSIAGSIAPGGITVDVFNALPEEFRPSGGDSRFGSAWRSGYTGNVVVRTTGTGGIAQRTVDWSGVTFSIAYTRI